MDTKDADQDAIITTKADIDYVDAQNEIQNIAMNDAIATTNDTIAANKADQAVTDASQNTVITNNRNEYIANNTATNDRITNEVTRLDDVNTAQNSVINGKADTVYVDSKNADQDKVIEQHAVALDKKADLTYVNQVKSEQDKQINATTALLGAGAVYDSATGTITGPSYQVENKAYNTVGDAFDATNDRIDNLYNSHGALREDMKQLGYDLSAGVASGAALEQAPFVAGKYTYALGMASFNGEQAIGATLRKTSDDGRWSINGGVSTNTQSQPLFKIGITGVIK